MPLPLFIVVRLVAPFTKRRFGFFGARVVPGLIFDAGRGMAFQMGAVLGKARPDLIEPLGKAYSDQPSDPGRVHALREGLAQAAEDALAQADEPQTFDDLVEPYPGFPHLGTWVGLREAAASHAMYLLVGLEFGVRKPALTRRLVEKDIARQHDELSAALLKAGLKLPGGPGFESYEACEQFVLSEVEGWQRKWGAKADEWQRNMGVNT